MTNKNARRGFTQKIVNDKKETCPEGVLIRTYRPYRTDHKEKALYNNGRCVEDAEQKHLSIRLFNKKGFTLARSVTPQGRYAGYSGRIGFTLIELLVVILIIGILATVALPQYQKAVVKSKYASMKTLVNTLYQAEKTYFLEHGSYSDNFDQLDLNVGKKVGIRHRSFPFGKCYMIVESYIYCQSTIPPISYVQSFSGERSCVAYDNNPLSKRICIEETNNTPDPDSNRAAHGWYRYP